MPRALPAAQSALDFVSPCAALVAEPPPRTAAAVVWIVLALFGSSVAVAGLCPIERVVEARGRVATPGATLTVQPLETAIVRSVEVRPNQVVRAGEVLARLDPTFTTADASTLATQVAAAEAEIARLEAETNGRPFRPAAQDAASALQAAIHGQRMAEYGYRMETYRQKLGAQRAALERSQESVKRLRERLEVAAQVEGMRRELERGQIGSRLNLLLATDGRLEVSRSLTAAEAEGRAAARDIEALQAESGAYAAQWRSAAAQALAERRVALAGLQESLSKARLRHSLVELTAPVDAVVLEVGKAAGGAVLQPGETLFTLVPLGAALEVEAEIAARDAGFVAVGDPVEIKLDAFPYTRHGTVSGTVRTISGDTFSRGSDGMQRPAFYRARISLDSMQRMRHLPADFRLLPGGPVTADVVVGQRTVLSYFFETMMKPFSEGLREP